MIRALRLAVTMLVLGTMTILLMPLQAVAVKRGWRLAAMLPYYWQRIAHRLIGMRLTVLGEPAKPPLLIAANHISWLDISVLGGVLPLSFIGKIEIASWPVLGTLARLQRTIFIDRNRRQQTGVATREIADRVGSGETVVLFPEGTTGDGNRILPFRSALVGAAGAATGRGRTITVQPVALAYVGLHGIPVGRSDRPAIAWYGDMDLIAHFRNLIGQGGIDVVVSFGEPIPFAPDTDRKQVTAACFAEVRRMIDEIRRGASRNLGAAGIFSPAAKAAKGTATAPGRSFGGTREEVANRAS
jgi:1-acyl-sn-glycerol-3-phosphate acyltransferase